MNTIVQELVDFLKVEPKDIFSVVKRIESELSQGYEELERTKEELKKAKTMMKMHEEYGQLYQNEIMSELKSINPHLEFDTPLEGVRLIKESYLALFKLESQENEGHSYSHLGHFQFSPEENIKSEEENERQFEKISPNSSKIRQDSPELSNDEKSPNKKDRKRKIKDAIIKINTQAWENSEKIRKIEARLDETLPF